jgi:hypothetical protein
MWQITKEKTHFDESTCKVKFRSEVAAVKQRLVELCQQEKPTMVRLDGRIIG